MQEPENILTKDGAPYSVFSPFRRAWEALPHRKVLAAPAALPPIGDLVASRTPSLTDLGLADQTAFGMVAAGEEAARLRLSSWADGDVDGYRDGRDRMDLNATSRLSQDLRWGLLSPTEIVERCAGTTLGRQSFISEICWREFYYHVLFHHPRVVREAFQPGYTTLAWNNDERLLDAWKNARTGYPVVDAAMRQLVATGWMHNRARMFVASFLTKDLVVDWRAGEQFFMEHLVDGDIASNNGGWQWAASTGTDPQPYFRIFNPVLQGQRFDPQGNFVRRWIPELERVDVKYLHAPWTMPADVQANVECVIGRDYPAPIVDHYEARQRALAVYKIARGGKA